MKFEITKTSDNEQTKPPFEGCVPDGPDPKYRNGYRPDAKVWVMEINSLEELLAFKDKVDNEVVITNPWREGALKYGLEIYDTYRE